jgi:hypothetical protein
VVFAGIDGTTDAMIREFEEHERPARRDLRGRPPPVQAGAGRVPYMHTDVTDVRLSTAFHHGPF